MNKKFIFGFVCGAVTFAVCLPYIAKGSEKAAAWVTKVSDMTQLKVREKQLREFEQEES